MSWNKVSFWCPEHDSLEAKVSFCRPGDVQRLQFFCWRKIHSAVIIQVNAGKFLPTEILFHYDKVRFFARLRKEDIALVAINVYTKFTTALCVLWTSLFLIFVETEWLGHEVCCHVSLGTRYFHIWTADDRHPCVLSTTNVLVDVIMLRWFHTNNVAYS